MISRRHYLDWGEESALVVSAVPAYRHLKTGLRGRLLVGGLGWQHKMGLRVRGFAPYKQLFPDLLVVPVGSNYFVNRPRVVPRSLRSR